MTIDHDALRAAAADIAYPDLYAQGVWDMRGTTPPVAPLKQPRRRPTSWVDHAACAGVDTNVFFPANPHDHRKHKEAKAICYRCPVLTQCLEACMEEEEYSARKAYGIRGGMTAWERRNRYHQMRKNKDVA